MTTIDQSQINETYLQKAAELLAPLKKASYAPINPDSSQNILDVGCGPGIDTCAMARLAGAGSTITGVDMDVNMVQAADARARAERLQDTVKHVASHADKVDFDDNTFDVVRSERLFIHLPDPMAVLREMVRVTKPGGTIIIVDTDWASLSTASGNDVVERKISHFMAEKFVNNGFSGRNLYGQMKTAGLLDVYAYPTSYHITDYVLWRLLGQMDQVEEAAMSASLMTPESLAEWHKTLRKQAEDGLFYSSMATMVATGIKPA